MDDVASSLRRQDQRRAAGTPTVSALAGPVGLCLQRLQAWADDRPLVWVDQVGLAGLIADFAASVGAGRDPLGDAAAWLAKAAGMSADWAGRFRHATTYERSLLGRPAFDALPRGPAAWTAKAAVEQPGSSWLALTQSVPDGERLAWLRGMVAVIGVPAVVVIACEEEETSADRIAAAASLLAEVAEALPETAWVLVAPESAIRAYLGAPPERRAKAMLRESVIEVRGLDESAARQIVADESIPPPALTRLVADGAGPELVELFRDAHRAAKSARPEDDDGARSLAERFLFARLQSHPRTAGRFRLNHKLPIPFGHLRQMEVDLFAPDWGLALEVDGYYHFRDADAYRRDRRKDLALQGHGCFVVRVLADDVTARLENVLDAILEAVQVCARRPPPASESPA